MGRSFPLQKSHLIGKRHKNRREKRGNRVDDTKRAGSEPPPRSLRATGPLQRATKCGVTEPPDADLRATKGIVHYFMCDEVTSKKGEYILQEEPAITDLPTIVRAVYSGLSQRQAAATHKVKEYPIVAYTAC